jgi:hypothetical protein
MVQATEHKSCYCSMRTDCIGKTMMKRLRLTFSYVKYTAILIGEKREDVIYWVSMFNSLVLTS